MSYYFLYKPDKVNWQILEKSEEKKYTPDSVQQRAIDFLETEGLDGKDIEFVDFRMTRDDSLKFRDVRVIRAKDASNHIKPVSLGGVYSWGEH